MSEREERIWWAEEMPLPTGNLVILQGIYILEQWLRRIALAALMANAGSKWVEALPAEVLPEAKKQVNLLKKRTLLEPENSDNLVWALTLEQLRVVLTSAPLSEFVFDLTGVSRRQLLAQLDKLREIRNIVAHNRATNDVALENFTLVRRRLEEGIRHFKLRLIYFDPLWEQVEQGITEERNAEGKLSRTLALPPKLPMWGFFEASGLAHERVFFVAQRERFYQFSVVQADPALAHADYLDIGRFLDACHEIRHALLALVLPLPGSDGSEFSVLWPKDVTDPEVEAIRNLALSVRAETDVAYERQDPKFVCDPLVWFEGGWEGAAQAGSQFLPRFENVKLSDTSSLDETASEGD